MPTTRSASKGSSVGTAPSSSPERRSVGAGSKRRAEDAPPNAKGGKAKKTQKTIEETMDADGAAKLKGSNNSLKQDTEPKAVSEPVDKPQPDSKNSDKPGENQNAASDHEMTDEKPNTAGEESSHANDESKAGKQDSKESDDTKNEAEDEPMGDANEDKQDDGGEKEDSTKKSEKESGESAVEIDQSRKKAEPSNILEKGLIYFFFRGRVNIHDPSEVSDIQRSYIILRPLPSGASLGDGPVHSGGKARILALPKKVLPKSPRDRFLCWTEAVNSSFDDIKKQHLDRSEYTTKTSGARETPAAQPAAEGIYALTATGRESHLAYILTVPDTLGKVQEDLGLSSRGAFVTSVRNPETGAPTGTAPEQRANYPKEIMDDFAGRRWGRLEPRHLDYQDTQFLLIGEHEDGKLEKSVKADEGDGTKEGKEEPKEEMELLEKEDEERIRSLQGDESDAIFKDLGLSKDEFSKIKTEW